MSVLENPNRLAVNKYKVRIDEDVFGRWIENIADILMLVNKKGKILYQSPSIVSILGWRPEDRIGKNVFTTELIHPEDVGKKDRFFRRLLRVPNKNMTTTYRIKHKEGGWRDIEAIGKNLLGNPMVNGIVVTYRDVTVRKELENRKDEFISIASHELRTPVTTLKLFNQLVRRNLVKKKEAELVKYMDKMAEQIEKLNNLVSDLLDVSRIQGGKLQLRKVKFSMKQLVKNTLAELKTVMNSHKASLRVVKDVTVVADKEKISQVLINLISNAVKYSPQSNKILVKIKPQDEGVTVMVQDYGIGIEEKYLLRIFERFYRINQTESSFPGLGVGLYVSLGIVKKHKGKMWVKSNLGKGSKFYFYLPAA